MQGFRVVNLIIQSLYLVFHLIFILFLYRKRQATPVWTWFFRFSVALWIWVSGRFIESIVYLFFPGNNAAYVFAANYQYIGNTIAVVEYVIWVLYLAGYDKLADSWAVRLSLFACPFIICSLVFTNQWHQLFYQKLVMGERVEHGVLFKPCVVWMYLILLYGYVISLRTILKSGKEKGKQIIMFSLFPMLPAIAVLARSITGIDRLDYTPMVMIVTILCLYQIVFRYHYVNIVPASLREALKQTSHPIGIYHPGRNELLYFNRAAENYANAAESFLPQLPTTGTRVEGDYDGKHLLIDVTALPEEELILVTVTDVSDVMEQQTKLNAQIHNLEKLHLELEEANRNIDAYLDSLYNAGELREKQDLITETYAMISRTFRTVEDNLIAAEQNPGEGEAGLQENLQLTRECITAIRQAVTKLKAG